jgi:hypothetical protein
MKDRPRLRVRSQSPLDEGRKKRRMTTPREETIPVGAIGVHTWVGGQGRPLLVLHGAGGNRGFTRCLRHRGPRRGSKDCTQELPRKSVPTKAKEIQKRGRAKR